MNGKHGPIPDEQTKSRIINFIKINDCTGSGNVTELSSESLERLLSTPNILAVLIKNNNIIGTMISPIFRAKYKDFSLLTSYTTFLCVDKKHREQGLAMTLIRAVMKEAHSRYNLCHGYYMSSTPHHNIHNEIKSWYRPINIKKSGEAGFTMKSFKNDRGGSSTTKQRLAYHVSKPSILPIKASPLFYELILRILQKGDLYLTPTYQEFEWLCKCFDIYTVNNDSMFMLFPMVSFISSTGKRVRNAQVALMIGDVLSHALWVANDNKYDLLYGWCAGDITEDRVSNIKGLITTDKSCLEFYNTRIAIPNNNIMVPIF